MNNRISHSYDDPVKDFSFGVSYRLDRTIDECELEPMSFMIGIKYKNGIVIATDSRETIKNEQQPNEYNDDFQKVFESENRIWGVIGYYGRNNNLLKRINDYIRTADLINEIDLTNLIKEYCFNKKIANNTINIFIGEEANNQLLMYIYDFGNSVVKEYNKISNMSVFECECKYAAGSNEMIVGNSIRDIELCSRNYEEIVSDTIKVVQYAIDADYAIYKLNHKYEQNIGGHVQYKVLTI